MLSVALQILHFQRFLAEHDIDINDFRDELAYLKSHPTGLNESVQLSNSFALLFDEYSDFCASTQAGQHGKPAQFFIQFVDLISIYHRFSRSIRCGNIDLYIDSISEMTDLFFVMNQPNYARWSTAYLSNLVALRTENSPLVADFVRGDFGVKRTSHTLARSPVDLTLEQTINADAGNTL